ncbi:MAG: hypothetical protein ACYDCL_07515 [Myxococcales bacterium]
MDRRRFEHLERARREGGPEPELDPGPAAERVAGVTADGATAGAATGFDERRFEAELPLAPEAQEPLFHRCRLCGADSQRGSSRCEHCEANLETPEQVAYDRRIFEREREEQRLEAHAAPEPVQLPAAQQQALAQAFAEEFASVREAQFTPGRRLLRRLPWPLRLLAVALLVGLVFVSGRLAHTGPRWALAFVGELLLGLVLFVPVGWLGKKITRPFQPW